MNARLLELYERQQAGEDIEIAYWNSDAWGRSANGGSTDSRWHANPGAIQKIDDDLKLSICPAEGQGGLHATHEPHKWEGRRVWIVALFGDIQSSIDKMAARKREIVCEITPDDLLSPQIAARMGVFSKYLQSADLQWAYLRDADLRGADLRDADLQCADLRGAVLRRGELRRADLRDAVLRRADLRDADLQCADLRGADLRRADLRRADLRGARLPFGYQPQKSALT